MDFFLFLFKYGLINGFLIGILFLFNRKGSVVPNRFYGFLVIALCFVVLENVLIMSKDIIRFPHIFSLGSMMLMIVPPLIYLLIKSLINPFQKITFLLIVGHFIPFVVMLILLWPLLKLEGQIKITIIEDIYYKGKELETNYLYYSAINIIQFKRYLVA